MPRWYGATATLALTPAATPIAIEVSRQVGVWAVEGALVLGIATVVVFAWPRVSASFAKASQVAIAGCLLATLNTASEFGFGAVIAALPGFLAIQSAMKAISNPLVNEAITVTALAGDDRIGVRRPEPRAGGDGRAVQGGGGRGAHPVRGAAPRRGDGLRAAWTRCRTTARSSRCWRSPA